MHGGRFKRNRRHTRVVGAAAAAAAEKKSIVIFIIRAPRLLATHHCLFFSSSRIPKTSGSASTRGVSASGKTPSIFAWFLVFERETKRRDWFFGFFFSKKLVRESVRPLSAAEKISFVLRYLVFYKSSPGENPSPPPLATAARTRTGGE